MECGRIYFNQQTGVFHTGSQQCDEKKITDEEISNLTTIDAFIERKQPFAVYRIPGEKIPCLVTQEEGAVRLIYDLQELNGQRGFVIAPFRPNETCPILLIQSNGPGQPLLLADDAFRGIFRQPTIPPVPRNMRSVFVHLSVPYVIRLLKNWCFPVNLLLENHRHFLLH